MTLKCEASASDFPIKRESKLNFVGVLPDEMSVKIFDYLDVNSLCRSLQTCSRWRDLIEGSSCLWRRHCQCYQNSLPCKKNDNKGTQWKVELKKVFLIHKFMKRWLAGEFSFPNSYEDLPGDHIQEMPTEVWGTILESELRRKSAQPSRTQ